MRDIVCSGSAQPLRRQTWRIAAIVQRAGWVAAAVVACGGSGADDSTDSAVGVDGGALLSRSMPEAPAPTAATPASTTGVPPALVVPCAAAPAGHAAPGTPAQATASLDSELSGQLPAMMTREPGHSQSADIGELLVEGLAKARVSVC